MNKKLIYLLLFICSFSYNNISAQNLELFSVNEKWGFKTKSAIKIPVQFEYATHFSEGFALVKSNGKWGYIDSTGAWFIEPQYDKGQPFQNNTAFVKKNGKIGLIALDFENELESQKKKPVVVLDPIYDDILENYNSYNPILNGKKGHLNKDNIFSKAVPAKYDKIQELSGNIISGKNNLDKWDIYIDGTLALENADNAIEYGEYDYFSGNIILKKDGKKGVYNLLKKWIIDAKYDEIEKRSFPSYKSNNVDLKDIYVLRNNNNLIIEDDIPVIDDDGNIISGSDSISIAKMDGTLVTNIKFDYVQKLYDIYSEIQPPYAMQLVSGVNIYNLYADFRLEKLKFSSITPHNYNSYYIGRTENKAYILDSKFNEIDSFYNVKKYQEFSNLQEYDEFGNSNYDYDYFEPTVVDVEEAFLIVFNKKEEQLSWAIYDLNERKVTTPWFDISASAEDFFYNEITINRTEIYGVNYATLFEYSFQNNMGFYLKGMDKGTEMKFPSKPIEIINSCFAVKNQVNELDICNLYAIENNKLSLLKENVEVLISTQQFNSNYNWEFDPETGEEMMDYATESSFLARFFILKENSKYGLVTLNGILVDTKYDSLIQNPEIENFVTTFSNNLFGNIDLNTGDILEPFSVDPLVFDREFVLNADYFYYTSHYDENYKELFISSKGQKFNNLPKSTFGKKTSKKAYELVAYPRYFETEFEPSPVNGVKYKYIEPYFIEGYFKAQGVNIKWGIIDFTGNTVLPLNYDNFTPYNFYNEGLYQLVVENKGKKGLYDLKIGEIIPAKYSSIEPIQLSDNYGQFFIVGLKGKLGLYHAEKGEILKTEFTSIYDMYLDSENNNYIIAEKDSKKFIYSIKNEFKNPLEFDFIADYKSYRKNGPSYEEFDLSTSKLIRTIPENDFKIKGKQFEIVCKNGKFGANDLNGKELIPCEYDNPSFMEYRPEIMIGYQNGEKYYIYVDTKERYTEQEW